MPETRGSKILILYAFSSDKPTELGWEKHLSVLPKKIQEKIGKYHRLQDRKAKLYGNLLLAEGLRDYGYGKDALRSVSRDRFGRPYVDRDVDFNLSHSDNWVVCALTCHGRVGIDIEKIKPIDISDFREYIGFDQWEKNKESENMYKAFYDFWTIKESVLKADGRGLSIPLEEVETVGDKAVVVGRAWFLTKLNISPDSSCHLASDLKDPEIEMKEVAFEG